MARKNHDSKENPLMNLKDDKSHTTAAHPHEAEAKTVTDPVCRMEIRPEDAAGTHGYKGKTYYFCNPSCLERFRESPDQYLEGRPAAAADDGREYICPMDPEVRQIGPGACPKCGMAL
ncbi:MAG TPA: YHS domain-containing protein, partial [Nitrospiria bacterium]